MEKLKYNLEERTAKFGEKVIDLVRLIKPVPINRGIIDQLVRAATSVGANYMEATSAESKKDFRHKISICRKEAKESRHFLRMLARSNPEVINDSRCLWQEAQEFTLIFSTIVKKCN